MIRFIRLAFIFAAFSICATSSWAKTLVVEGKLDGTVTVKNVIFSVDQPLSQFTYQFSVPSIYDNVGNVQRLHTGRKNQYV